MDGDRTFLSSDGAPPQGISRMPSKYRIRSSSSVALVIPGLWKPVTAMGTHASIPEETGDVAD
jgi:hypothetical protein